jgi:uncharacterized membrane protein YkoI
MKRHWQAFATFATGTALLTIGVAGARAHTGQSVTTSNPSAMFTSMRAAAMDVIDELGFADDSAGPGVIDDGEGLLPEAEITLEQALQAARASHPGALGEVDLEYVDGRLVFNVDIGDRDVKVDGATGEVLGATKD